MVSTEHEREGLAAIDRILQGGFPLRGKNVGAELRRADMDDALTVGSVSLAHGVWLAIRLFEPAQSWSMDGTVWLMEPEDLADPRRDALVSGWVSAMKRIVVQPSEPATRFAPGYLDQRMPIDVVSVPIAAKYEDAFLEAKWLGRFLPAKERTPRANAYEKAPKRAVTREGRIDLRALLLWIARHAELGYTDRAADLALLEALPMEVRTLWYLFVMEGKVRNGGVASFLLDGSAFEIEGSLHAVAEVGASRFAELLRRGIPLAAAEGSYAQFTTREDPYRCETSKAWRSGLQRDPSLASLSSLDGHDDGQSFFLIDHELRPCMSAWIERYEDALIREGKAVHP